MANSAFIFDLDGVLTDTAHLHFVAWRHVARSLGLDFDHQDNEQLKGIDRVNSLRWILRKGDIQLNETCFHDLLQSKNDHYLEQLENFGPDELHPGVLACFAELKRRNVAIGLASASKNARKVIDKLGIAQWFDHIGDITRVKQSKPAPDIFLAVAEALGIAPEHCIGIEDAVSGVSAIKAAGMYAVGIGQADVLQSADIVFADMANLDLSRLPIA